MILWPIQPSINHLNEELPQTATSCSIYTTTLKSLIYERMSLTVVTSAFSACFVRLSLAVQAVLPRILSFLHLPL